MLRLVAGMAVLVAAAGVASARPRLAIRVVVDPHARSAVGRMVLDVDNPTAAPLDHLELWRFPARLGQRSPAIDEHNFYWLYPRSFDGGGMELSEVRVDGKAAPVEIVDHPIAGKRTLVRVRLATPLAPGGHARLECVFATRVPLRYGEFGCYRDGCTLAGGFYPMPVELGAAGFDESAPPARADIDLTVEGSAPEVLIDGVAARTARLVDAPYATVVAGRATRERILVHRGVTAIVRIRGDQENPPFPILSPRMLESDRAGLLLDDVRESLEMLHDLGLDVPDGTTVRFVEAPLRMELAEAHGGVVLFSDELYRIFPWGRFRKFHSFQLVGALFNLLIERRLAARERPADLGWSPDVAAAWLVDLYTLRIYQKKETATDILKWVSFIPSIDRIIYAPQVPFATAYFNTLDEPDPTRDDPRRFANERPRGKTIHEKLRDLVGDEGMTRAARALWQGVPVREAAEAEYGKPLDWFFAEWLRPYPEVDYKFALLATEAAPGGLRNRIRIYKEGAAGATVTPMEPVELRVTEWGGTVHDLKWDGRAAETVLTVDTTRGIRSITLDPRGRLLERIASGNDDLRLDNRSPRPVKFIYNNFGALINFQTLSLDLSLDFSLIPIYDVKNSARLAVFHSEATQIGALIGYQRSFGRMVTPSRLSSALTTTLRVSRLEPGFARGADAPQPGTRVSVSAGLGYDDRFFVWEPTAYSFGGISAAYSLTALDSGHIYQQGSASISGGRVFPIVPGHGVAFEAGLASTFGDLQIASQALFAGGPSGLRGYTADELAGRTVLHARAEYRHVFVHDLSFNLLHLATVRGVAGGAFVEAAIVTPCGGGGLVTSLVDSAAAHGGAPEDVAHNLFADVGYSLRLMGDWIGVSQTLFNLDLAVPLVRRARGCFDAHPIDPATRPPLGFFVYFGPVW